MQTTINTEELICHETLPRSFIKSIIYRLLSLVGTVVITWIITKNVSETIIITMEIQAFLVVLYFFYERLWNRIQWGKTFGGFKK